MSADHDCVAFLQWALPRLGLRWSGFRRVRRQVCRRIGRRVEEIGLEGLDDYRRLLESRADEWTRLERLCRVTISRFLRDREVFRRLAETVLPELAERAEARGARVLRAWSVGSASGEEPYSLALAWRLGPTGAGSRLRMSVVACDVDVTMLARARRRLYAPGSLREVPSEWLDRAFDESRGLHRLRDEIAADVSFFACDVRRAPPSVAFDLVSCRNLVFTYFDDREQVRVGRTLVERLASGGVLVVGGHEAVPTVLEEEGLEPLGRGLYRKTPE